MKKSHIEPTNTPRAFDISELFVSTTDRKGIITGFNEVFVRIAAYPGDELLQKPHNIIRHPDMPRCVFKLLWDYILDGKPIGAYVKNMAKTGEYYWVFALVVPIDDGFLSVRLKPTSKIFSTVMELYNTLLTHENSHGKDWRKGMKQSGDLLMASIMELGFESYEDFMLHALREEMQLRQQHLSVTAKGTTTNNQKQLWTIFKQVEALNSLRQDLTERAAYFNKTGFEITKIALNASIMAAKLAKQGAALGIISEEVSKVASEIITESKCFATEVDRLKKTLQHASLLVALCVLLSEMLEFSKSSQENYPASLVTGYQKALRQCDSYTRELTEVISLFSFRIDTLSKFLLNLQLAYITGKSIAVRTNHGGDFAALLDQLFRVSETSRDELEALKGSVSAVKRCVIEWHRSSIFSEAKPASAISA